MIDYKYKYLKYKTKYLNIKKNIKTSVENNLKYFQEMNFIGFNDRYWDIVDKYIDDNVITIMADGSKIKGKEDTIYVLMKQALEWAPDTKVIEHRIQFGSDNWIAVNMIISGTFTKSITMPDKIIKANHKRYQISNCVLAKWNNMKIIELYVFSDSSDMLKQLS